MGGEDGRWEGREAHLHGAVEEGGRGAVGVEVDDVKGPVRLAAERHEHGSVRLRGLQQGQQQQDEGDRALAQQPAGRKAGGRAWTAAGERPLKRTLAAMAAQAAGSMSFTTT